MRGWKYRNLQYTVLCKRHLPLFLLFVSLCLQHHRAYFASSSHPHTHSRIRNNASIDKYHTYMYTYTNTCMNTDMYKYIHIYIHTHVTGIHTIHEREMSGAHNWTSITSWGLALILMNTSIYKQRIGIAFHEYNIHTYNIHTGLALLFIKAKLNSRQYTCDVIVCLREATDCWKN